MQGASASLLARTRMFQVDEIRRDEKPGWPIDNDATSRQLERPGESGRDQDDAAKKVSKCPMIDRGGKFFDDMMRFPGRARSQI
jgi:hypothetical protein